MNEGTRPDSPADDSKRRAEAAAAVMAHERDRPSDGTGAAHVAATIEHGLARIEHAILLQVEFLREQDSPDR
jgi:hypothetical protein